MERSNRQVRFLCWDIMDNIGGLVVGSVLGSGGRHHQFHSAFSDKGQRLMPYTIADYIWYPPPHAVHLLTPAGFMRVVGIDTTAMLPFAMCRTDEGLSVDFGVLWSTELYDKDEIEGN